MGRKPRDIGTGHRTFDAQMDHVGTGNVSSRVQFSGYIRPVGMTDCNGILFEPGVLRDHDLRRFGNLPGPVRAAVLRETRERQCILYGFRHVDGPLGSRRVVVHGYVLTRDHHEQHELVAHWVTGPTAKSRAVVERMLEVVSTPPGTHDLMRTEAIPERVAAMEGRLLGEPRADVRAAVAEIARIVGGDPDIGVSTEGRDGWNEARNIWRALAFPDMASHFRFSVAGEEALAAAAAVIDRLGPGLGGIEGEPPTAAEAARLLMQDVLAVAGEAGRVGLPDEGWAMRAFAARAAGRDPALAAPGPRA